MDGQLLLIFALTFVIHLIGTLAYSVRIAGTRTGRIAVSFALFNILVLVSRTSNSFQAPLLAKWVEENLLLGTLSGGYGGLPLVAPCGSTGHGCGRVLDPDVPAGVQPGGGLLQRAAFHGAPAAAHLLQGRAHSPEGFGADPGTREPGAAS